MDAELLAKQISTLQEAIVKLDGRVDALLENGPSNNEATVAYEARLAALEEQHAQCSSQLEALTEATARIAEAEAREAEAEADAAEAEAEIMQQIADEPSVSQPLEEMEETTEEEVTELEIETEENSPSNAAGAENKSSKWWENLLTLR